MLENDCFIIYRHVKYYFRYKILTIFDSKSLNHFFSFLTAVRIDLMLFEVEQDCFFLKEYKSHTFFCLVCLKGVYMLQKFSKVKNFGISIDYF